MSDDRRQQLLGEKEWLEDRIGQLDDDRDALQIGSFRARLEDIEDELASLEEPQTVERAEAELIFEGEPVDGNRGLEGRFATDVMDDFRRLVYTFRKDRRDMQNPNSRVSNTDSKLYLTDVVRGQSVGMRFREVGAIDENQLVDGELVEVVESVRALVSDLTDPDSDVVGEIADADLESSTCKRLTDFFESVGSKRADLQFKSVHGREHASSDAVERVVSRLNDTEVNMETDREIPGRVAGLLTNDRRFEFDTPEFGLLKGRVSSEVSDRELRDLHREFAGKECIGVFDVKVIKNDAEDTEERKYRLQALLPK